MCLDEGGLRDCEHRSELGLVVLLVLSFRFRVVVLCFLFYPLFFLFWFGFDRDLSRLVLYCCLHLASALYLLYMYVGFA